MALPKKLWKTKIVIWSDYNPTRVEINDLAQEAVDGASICTERTDEAVERDDLEADPDWGGAGEFFDEGHFSEGEESDEADENQST